MSVRVLASVLSVGLLVSACGPVEEASSARVPGKAAPSSVPGAPGVPESVDAPEPLPVPEEWSRCSCITCHGNQGEGTTFGPELPPVLKLYLGVEATRAKARERLVGYILEPQKVPTLREGAAYTVPMPPLSKVDGTRADAEVLADYLLSLVR